MKVNQILVTINNKRRYRITADTIDKVFECEYAIDTIEIRVTESASPRSHYKKAIVVFEKDYSDTFNLEHLFSNFKFMIEKLLSYDGIEEEIITYAYTLAQDTVNAVVVELKERYEIDNSVNIYKHSSLSGCMATLDTALWLLDVYKEDITTFRMYAVNFITDKEITLFGIDNPVNIKQYKELVTAIYNYATKTAFRLLDTYCHQNTSTQELIISIDKDNYVAIETTDNREYIACLSACFDTLKGIKIIKTTNKCMMFRSFVVKNDGIWHALLKTDLIYLCLDVDTTRIFSLSGVIYLIPWAKTLKRRLYRLLSYINRVDIAFRGSWHGVGLKKVQTCIGLTPAEVDRLYTRYDIIKEVKY